MAKAKKESSGAMTMVGVSAAAAAAAAAAAYWFYGSAKAGKHRTQAKGWMLKARADVMQAVEVAVKKVGELDKESYMKIVDSVMKKYAKMKAMVPAEMAQMTKDMHSAWVEMQKAGKTASKKAGKKVVKIGKKMQS